MNLNHILFYVALFSISAEAYDWSETKQQLISGKPKEQQEAMAKFGKGDRTAVPVLIEIVAKEKDSAARARAGQTLIRLMKIPANRTPADIPTLGALVDSEDRAVAGAALGALANFQGDAHAKQYIRRAIAAKRDDFIRAQAVGCLSIVSEHDGSEGEFLKDLLKDKAELVRVRAAYSLGKSNSADGLPVVLEILRRPPGNGQALMIISEAASAAGEIGDPSAVSVLEKIAKSKNEYGFAKGEAIVALKNIKFKGIVSRGDRIIFLATLLADPNCSRWAGGKLLTMPGPDTISVLDSIAKNSTNAGRSEAARILAAYQEGQP